MATSLTPDAMKERVRAHFAEFVDAHRPEVIHRNMTADFLDHDGPGGRRADADGDERMMRAMLEARPDLTVRILDMIAEGDRVVCRNIWRWTDRETGEGRTFQGFVCWRFEGELIAERWATVTSPASTSSWIPV